MMHQPSDLPDIEVSPVDGHLVMLSFKGVKLKVDARDLVRYVTSAVREQLIGKPRAA